MNNLITSIRRLLIRFGKSISFILCFIVLISYTENLVAVSTNDFIVCGDYIIPNTPVSYKLASIFEYDWLTIVAVTILSYAIETCLWNKLSIAYLALQLLLKTFISKTEISVEQIQIICFINIAVCVWLCWNGLRRILRPSDAIS